MANEQKKCRCKRGKRAKREGWHCHHEMAEVRKKAAAELTSAEIEAAKQRMKKMLKRRPEEKRGLPLPREIKVVQGGAPGSGKRA